LRSIKINGTIGPQAFNPVGTFTDIRVVLWWLSLACECIAAALFFRRRLAARYPFFTLFLCADLVRSISLNFLGSPRTSKAYAVAWMASDPIATLLAILVVLELYWAICAHYRDFARISRAFLLIAAIGSIVICAVTLGPDLRAVNWRAPQLQLVVLWHRAVFSVLAIFLLLTTCFCLQFKVPLRRNVVVHGRLLTVYLCGHILGYLIANMTAMRAAKAVNLFEPVVETLCFAGWALLINRNGENVEPLPPPDREQYQLAVDAERAALRMLKQARHV